MPVCHNLIMRYPKIFLSSGIVFSLIVVITAFMLARGRTSMTGKASVKTGKYSSLISANNSYVYASPVRAKADGESPIRINVYLFDSRGLAIPEQKVSLNLNPGLNFINVLEITDSTGRATFDCVSTIPGQYTIKASALNANLGQQVVISFD